MPSPQVLQPVLKMKVDELFLNWLSDPATQSLLKDYLDLIKSGRPVDLSRVDARDKRSFSLNANNNVASQMNLAEKKPGPLGATSSPPSTGALPSRSSSNTSRATGPSSRVLRRSASTKKVIHLILKRNMKRSSMSLDVSQPLQVYARFHLMPQAFI